MNNYKPRNGSEGGKETSSILHPCYVFLMSAALLFDAAHSWPLRTNNYDDSKDNTLATLEESPWHQINHQEQANERLTYTNSYATSLAGPYIENSHSVNISAQEGSHAYLPCIVKRLGSKLVSWVRFTSNGLQMLTVDRDTFIGDNRFEALHVMASDTWTLHIRNVLPTDEGFYECQVSSEPKTSLLFQLHVITPRVEIKGSPEIYVNSGSYKVELQCLLTDVLEEPPFIFWYRDDQRLQTDSIDVTSQLYRQPQAAKRIMSRAETWKKNNGETKGIVYSQPFSENLWNAEEDGTESISFVDYLFNYDTTRANDEGSDIGMDGVWPMDSDPFHPKWSHSPTKSEHARPVSIKSADILRMQPGVILSRLTIFSPTTLDSGQYQCRPSNLSPSNVTLHVLDGEHEEPAAAVQSDGTNSSSSSHSWRWYNISAALVTVIITTSIVRKNS